MKIVINNCFGGFSISDEFATELGLGPYRTRDDSLRTDPRVITALESGRNINGQYAKLKIVEVPEGVSWHIAEYDGLEHVAENHRTWN